jgi:hypothetical protein
MMMLINLTINPQYTANLAAVLTAAAVATGIQSLADLVGRAVAAHGVYVDRLLTNARLRASPLDWGGGPFFQEVRCQASFLNVTLVYVLHVNWGSGYSSWRCVHLERMQGSEWSYARSGR